MSHWQDLFGCRRPQYRDRSRAERASETWAGEADGLAIKALMEPDSVGTGTIDLAACDTFSATIPGPRLHEIEIEKVGTGSSEAEWIGRTDACFAILPDNRLATLRDGQLEPLGDVPSPIIGDVRLPTIAEGRLPLIAAQQQSQQPGESESKPLFSLRFDSKKGEVVTFSKAWEWSPSWGSDVAPEFSKRVSASVEAESDLQSSLESRVSLELTLESEGISQKLKSGWDSEGSVSGNYESKFGISESLRHTFEGTISEKGASWKSGLEVGSGSFEAEASVGQTTEGAWSAKASAGMDLPGSMSDYRVEASLEKSESKPLTFSGSAGRSGVRLSVEVSAGEKPTLSLTVEPFSKSNN